MKNVLEYLEKSCVTWPDKAALVDQNKSLTYSELQENARRIGTCLAKFGHPCKPVGVLIQRNIESLVLFLGVVYSGNFYVPLDPQMPEARMTIMLNKLSPAVVIGLENDIAAIENWNTASYEQMIKESADPVLLQAIRTEQLDEDPLYAMFTSGSTGVPKSVIVSHRGVIDLTERFAECFPFTSDDRFGNQAPFDFDVSVKDLYQVLRQGATMVVIPKVLFSMPAKLIHFMNQHQITTVIWSVSALRIVAQLKTFRTIVPQMLRLIMFSGEVMPVKVLNYWRSVLPDAMFVNLYGPTEITCNCTYYIVDCAYADDEVLPIGKAFPNTRILILNERNSICDINEVGEICVSGAGVALGYYGEDGKTKDVFVQNPQNSNYRQIIYRTGDLGCFDAEGQLWFQGRKDHQIKHMGHRIELGEIEAAVNAIDFIDVGCCVFDEEKGKIVLFYQAQAPCEKEILQELCKKLPKYMWPNRLVHKTEFPLNSHGKVDRKALKKGI